MSKRELDFYQVTENGAIALTQLGMDNPKARSLIDWLAMYLVQKNSTNNAVMVSTEKLQDILGCGASAITRAIKAAEQSRILGVARYGNSRVFFLNPNAIHMASVKSRKGNPKFRLDVALVIDKSDEVYKSLMESSDIIDAYKTNRSGVDQKNDAAIPKLIW